MGETIKTGGVGKNPAIEKINQLNAISGKLQAASEMERKAFTASSERAKAQLKRREQIIDRFDIGFQLQD